jgi:REP element-mobilizing transposase RayT
MPFHRYDKPSWSYFITICTWRKTRVLGRFDDNGTLQLNPLGAMVRDAMLTMPQQRARVRLDAWVVMPNHIHLLITLPDTPPDPMCTSLDYSLGDVIGRWKAYTTLEYLRGIRMRRWEPFSDQPRLWQRNYYECIVRSPRSFERIRRYILNNPYPRRRRR